MTVTTSGMKTRFGMMVALAMTAGLAACADDKMMAAAPVAAPAPIAAPAPAPMKAMSKMEQTKALQTALNSNGAKLKADGVAGKKTTAAVAAFQKAKGMKATGKVDDKTAAALGVM
jgi:peptidoglycan hydrolase-like protein with peptidoglycan-binding domain